MNKITQTIKQEKILIIFLLSILTLNFLGYIPHEPISLKYIILFIPMIVYGLYSAIKENYFSKK